MRRAAIVCALAALIAAAACCPAGAARPGPDRSFGSNGHVPLRPPRPAGVKKFQFREWRQAADGAVYVLASSECRGCGDPSSFLFKFDRGGRLVRSFGGRHGFVKMPRGEGPSQLKIDARGRALLTFREQGYEVRRFTVGGRPDPSFGRRGAVRLPKLNRESEAEPATVSLLPGGGLLVASETYVGRGFARFHLEELREDGTPDGAFGHRGVAAVDAAGEFHLEDGPTVTPSGSILIGSECCGTVSLTRVSARGRLDTQFDRAARRGLRPLAALSAKYPESAELSELMPRADGGVDLLGYVWPRGFELRIKGDGRPDPRFSRNGLKVLPLPVSTAARLPGGGLFVTGTEPNEPTVASVLRGDGSADRRFPPTSLGPGSYQAAPPIVSGGRASTVYGVPVGRDEEFQYRPILARFLLPTAKGEGR
jgi:hypothetical protein